jgi:hypothetical protein
VKARVASSFFLLDLTPFSTPERANWYQATYSRCAVKRSFLTAVIGNDNTDKAHAVFLPIYVKYINVIAVVWLVRTSHGGDLYLRTKAAVQIW